MNTAAKQVEVTERPIIFSAPMVKAISDGCKTQTRRVIKPQPARWIDRYERSMSALHWLPSGVYLSDPEGFMGKGSVSVRMNDSPVRCPYGTQGDCLWVRETWQPYREHSAEQNAIISESLARFQRGQVADVVAEVKGWPFPPNGERRVLYASDFGEWAYNVDSDLKPWKSPIHMPRWASRITLEITNVRVERVQEISGADAKAEGVEPFLNRDTTAWRAGFQVGWDEINAKRGYSWASNPWVWVIEFKKL